MKEVNMSQLDGATGYGRPIRLSFAVMATAIAMVLAISISETYAGKGGTKPNGDPTLPDARYELTWLDGDGWSFFPQSINDLGEIAGHGQCCYDPKVGYTGETFAVAYSPIANRPDPFDLNDLEAQWMDGDEDVTGSWTARYATDVNDQGEIVGQAFNEVGTLRGFVLTDAFGDSPQFFLLPDDPELILYRMVINDGGVIVCPMFSENFKSYDPATDSWVIGIIPSGDERLLFNDNGVIARRSSDNRCYVRFPSGYMLTLEGFRICGMSNNWLCGHRIGTKGKNGQPGGWIRIDLNDPNAEPELILETNWAAYVYEINDVGSSVCELSPYSVFVGEPYDVAPLDILIESPDSFWLDATVKFEGINNPNPITDPDETGLGQICGWALVPGNPYRGFILTPIDFDQ